MKRSLFTGFVFILILSACTKSNNNSEMNGSWRLAEVYDKNTSTVSFPPSQSDMNIVITFLTANSFAGHTFRNSFAEGKYTQNGSTIVFESFSTTKVGEDQWGQSFLTVLYACSLQSASPCVPSQISIQGNVMKITTPLRYDITLTKL